MQLQVQNNQSFTGVLPVKFRLDDRFIHNEGFIKSSGDEICNILKSAIKNPENAGQLAKNLEKIDPDYNIKALHGRLSAMNGQIGVSGMVKFLVHGKNTYILTGKDAEKLKLAGKKIALCKHDMKASGQSNIAKSNLNNALKNYGTTIHQILADDLSRVTSGMNEYRQRMGYRVGLLCDMDIIKQGRNLKLKLQDAIFSSMVS